MIKYRGHIYREAALRVQYHSAPVERLDSILEKGLLPPRNSSDVTTFQHSEIPTISTTDSPENASVYNPSGVLFTLSVRPNTKWMRRSTRNTRKSERLVDSVRRWVQEAQDKGYDAIHVEGMQSTVGNQILNPDVLEVTDYEIIGQH